MEWERAIEEERAALGRVVALLCALAILAERAAGRSPVVRGLVLWFLHRAEAVARDFVAGDAPSASMPPVDAGPADALRLASSLRSLAQQLGRQVRLLHASCRRASRGPAALAFGRMPALGEALACLSGLAAFASGVILAAGAPDTS